MFGSTNEYLYPAQFGTLLGVQPRRTSQILGQLEALDFDLPPDLQGARLIHPDLAKAVRAARAEARDLATLREDPTLRRFLVASERDRELDLLSLVINASAELAVVRGAISALASGLQNVGIGDWQTGGWHGLGLPDPRGEL